MCFVPSGFYFRSLVIYDSFNIPTRDSALYRVPDDDLWRVEIATVLDA